LRILTAMRFADFDVRCNETINFVGFLAYNIVTKKLIALISSKTTREL